MMIMNEIKISINRSLTDNYNNYRIIDPYLIKKIYCIILCSFYIYNIDDYNSIIL